ncbi:MAG: hypothetical protein E6K96_00220 [Thaumarchaeota archaeon]|nr:MAG: hypothetical protein E6K96_00220 [Nitrososphaerota archaeon]
MDYFQAVQEGRTIVQRAIKLLQEVAGPSYPVLFMKTGRTDWSPVGEENLYSVIDGKNDTAAVVICDSDGNTKAMSTWLSKGDAAKSATILESRGIVRFRGEVKLPI